MIFKQSHIDMLSAFAQIRPERWVSHRGFVCPYCSAEATIAFEMQHDEHCPWQQAVDLIRPMKTAKRVRVIMDQNPVQALYRLDPPMKYGLYDYEQDCDVKHSTEFVVVSATGTKFTFNECETYIFACDEQGEWTSGMELPGSRRYTFSHAQVLESVGYTIIIADDEEIM